MTKQDVSAFVDYAIARSDSTRDISMSQLYGKAMLICRKGRVAGSEFANEVDNDEHTSDEDEFSDEKDDDYSSDSEVSYKLFRTY